MLTNDTVLYYIHPDVHTIAVLKTSESYEALRDGFRDAIASINSLADDEEIELEGITYNVEVVCCADYKVSTHLILEPYPVTYNTQFLLTLMGMKAASSQHSCIWCEVKDTDRLQQNVII